MNGKSTKVQHFLIDEDRVRISWERTDQVFVELNGQVACRLHTHAVQQDGLWATLLIKYNNIYPTGELFRRLQNTVDTLREVRKQLP